LLQKSNGQIKKYMKNKIKSIIKDIIIKDDDIGFNNKKPRDSWLEENIKNIPKGKTILDAGAGELQYKNLCAHLQYTSQDFAKYDGVGNSEGRQTGSWDNSKIDIISDITSIPVKNESFDAIMCIEVFEHLPEPALAIKEFSRIIKSKGTLILTAPFCSVTHFAPYYFANGYSKYWYEKILKDNGFEIIEIDFNGNFFKYLAQELRHITMMEEKYTKQKGKIISRSPINILATKIILNLLNKLSQLNNKSEEILCFGLHVLAVKK